MIHHYLWPQVSVYLHKTWQFIVALMQENLLCDLGGAHDLSVWISGSIIMQHMDGNF